MNRKGFSKLSNKVVAAAIRTAGGLGHLNVGPEHLLAAIGQTPECDAFSILCRHCGAQPDLCGALAQLLGRGDATRLTQADFSAELEGILHYASVCSAKLGDNCVGTEQLLAALLHSENRLVMEMLRLCGVDERGVRNDCRAVRPERKAESYETERRPSRSRTLDKYTVDLTAEAAGNRLDEVICRDEEIARMIAILARRKKNNVCLVGEPGVGKTAVAEGLALRIARGLVPQELKGKRLLSLDIASMVAGTKYRGDFEERFKSVSAEIVRAGDIIVFIDEMHMLMGAGAAEGAVDASNILKPMLTDRGLWVIGATTAQEYAKHIEKDKAFARRFTRLEVNEPTPAQAKKILESQITRLERHHGVRIAPAARDAAVELSRRYVPDRYLPDKALDLLDETAANKRLGLCGSKGARSLIVGERDVARTVSNWTGIPAAQLSESESSRLRALDEILRRRVIGQDAAVAAVCAAVKRARTGLKEENRPSGSFLFCGPTGVGKTEVCRALAAELFGSEQSLLRFDMSEYMDKSTLSRLVGAAPGYVGHGEGGQLTDAVRKRPYSLVLFDEAEKACPEFFNLMLQVLEEGCLTDGCRNKVGFSNCVIVFTTNLGAKHIADNSEPLGFAARAGSREKLQELVQGELKSFFSPEFLNRIDETVIFNRLGRKETERIADLLLDRLCARLRAMGFKPEVAPQVASVIADTELTERFGARPLRRRVTRLIENPISELILSGKIKSGERIGVAAIDSEIQIISSCRSPQAAQAMPLQSR